MQIALGGWVSSNYAALACVDLPTCHGEWFPEMDFRHGFQLVRELGKRADGGHLAYEALTAIHWSHRVGALVTFIYLGVLTVALARLQGFGAHAFALGTLLLCQVALGIAMGAMGSDVAIETADVALMGEDLRHLPQTLTHARRARSIMLQNVGLSLALIAILIPLAALGVLGLAAVVLVHEVAEIFVIGNGVRAGRARPLSPAPDSQAEAPAPAQAGAR